MLIRFKTPETISEPVHRFKAGLLQGVPALSTDFLFVLRKENKRCAALLFCVRECPGNQEGQRRKQKERAGRFSVNMAVTSVS
jgi:hypothetical protein